MSSISCLIETLLSISLSFTGYYPIFPALFVIISLFRFFSFQLFSGLAHILTFVLAFFRFFFVKREERIFLEKDVLVKRINLHQLQAFY